MYCSCVWCVVESSSFTHSFVNLLVRAFIPLALQAFVVDLFSPHDGSIDLRVLSECFLESDFVENEVQNEKGFEVTLA